MPGDYIVRTRDNRLTAFYYSGERSIKYKRYENSGWSAERTLIDDTSENFTVNIADNGNLYLFCQDKYGNVILCMKSGDEWKTKTMIRNSTDNVQRIQFNALITGSALSVIYNSSGGRQLVLQQLDRNGTWQPPANIDNCASLPGSLFSVHNTSPGHVVLLYLTTDNNLVYREINQNQIGAMNIIYSTPNQIIDYSFMAAHDAIHFLFVIKSMFTCQLAYRKKDSMGFGNIIMLWEGPRFENCMLFKVRNALYATYTVNEQMYYISSGDNGGTFTRPVRYKDKLPTGTQKGVYVTEDYDGDEFFCRDIYLDRNQHVVLLPTLCDKFYPEPEAINDPPPVSDELTEKFAMLQNRYDTVRIRLDEKDRQIIELTNQLKERNEELIKINNDWKKRHKKLLEEYEDYKYNAKRGEIKMKNMVLDTIASRSSVRDFTDKKLTAEQLEILTNAALAAPSGMNQQPWQVVLVTNAELMTEIEKACFESFEKKQMQSVLDRLESRGGTLFYHAPAVIFIAVKDKAKMDAGILVQNIALAAKSIGLDSCIIGLSATIFGDGIWEERLQFPEGYTFGVSIAVGYAAKEFKPHELDRSKVTIID